MKAVVPGSFDPVTSGHIDVIERAARVFGEVIVAVAPNLSKRTLFTVEERVQMLREATSHLPNVRVDAFEGLLVDYVQSLGANVIVKGLRAVSDFEFEFQMALMNRNLNPGVETVFMMTGAEYSYLSSSIVREIAALGGSVNGLVPKTVEYRLREKFSQAAGG
ncbi:MAG TPA: pantetheine-phosphate adenylyltransferase [Armatimonadota bacterium]|jgi:pantetheine-phosphate adenylyltransferase|nr:pantetheine-phosphate adenylyltransferase [Armatimonadota bacterium]HOM71506.1 pantetheine-phosphate adenylyltransferase [Armatimonadota bacterium]HOP80502.1 pantetheine-phosphate adenylyltransferase [Armatimonadota bacterium]HPP74617.1 pantetheine-phosphate adenylyltransferase [Armatimonadota bacterium]